MTRHRRSPIRRYVAATDDTPGPPAYGAAVQQHDGPRQPAAGAGVSPPDPGSPAVRPEDDGDLVDAVEDLVRELLPDGAELPPR